MKPMIYRKECYDREILHSGEIDGIKFYIVSYGTHPCAYVVCNIDDETAYNEIECHGGITYTGKTFEEFDENENCIGWVYNHYGDCNGSFEFHCDRKWTTEEILEEVKDVIKQVKKYEN